MVDALIDTLVHTAKAQVKCGIFWLEMQDDGMVAVYSEDGVLKATTNDAYIVRMAKGGKNAEAD